MFLQSFYAKLSPQEKKIFYIFLGVAVLVGFDLLFFQPVSSSLKKLDQDIAETQKEIKHNVKFLAYQEKILKEDEAYHSYQTDEKKTQEEVTATFLKTIENLATEAEVNLVKLNPGESTSKKGYVQYHANVECNGELENIVKFVHKVDTTNNLLKVVKMNIIGKKSSQDEVTVTMKIAKLIIDAKTADGGDSTEDMEILKHSDLVLAGKAIPLKAKGKGSESPPGAAGGSGGVSGDVDGGADEGIEGGGGEGSAGDVGDHTEDITRQNSLNEELSPASVARDTPPLVDPGQGKNLFTIWNDFWGIKPKPPPEPKPLTEEQIREMEKEEKPNFIQKILQKSSEESEQTPEIEE